MKRLLILCALTAPLLLTSACQSFSLDKERATERRKQALCSEIDTRDLPHCTGMGTDISAISPETKETKEDKSTLAKVAQKVLGQADE